MTLTCRIGLLLLALIPCLLGCEEDEVAWLPDSSGVIYRNKEQGYSVYSLRTKSEREVLKAKEDGPAIEGVTVSPKGDQFALVEITYGEEPLMEVVLHPLQGKEVHRSGKYKFPKRKGDMDYASTDLALEWSRGGPIVIYSGRELLGFYDPQTSKLTNITGYGRYLDGSYVGSELLPDGSGVLAAKLPPKKPVPEGAPPARDPNYVPFPDVAVIDWKGTVRIIKAPAIPAPVKKLVEEVEAPCFAYYADWKNNVLQLQVQDYRFDIDPRGGAARWWSLPLNMERQVPRRDPNSNYHIIPVGTAGVYVYAKGTENQDSSLEVMNTRARSHHVVGKYSAVEGAVRSPDGNKIAITVTERFREKKTAQRKVVIIDQTGTVVATLLRADFPFEDPPPMPAEPDGPVAFPAERAPDARAAPGETAPK